MLWIIFLFIELSFYSFCSFQFVSAVNVLCFRWFRWFFGMPDLDIFWSVHLIISVHCCRYFWNLMSLLSILWVIFHFLPSLLSSSVFFWFLGLIISMLCLISTKWLPFPFAYFSVLTFLFFIGQCVILFVLIQFSLLLPLFLLSDLSFWFFWFNCSCWCVMLLVLILIFYDDPFFVFSFWFFSFFHWWKILLLLSYISTLWLFSVYSAHWAFLPKVCYYFSDFAPFPILKYLSLYWFLSSYFQFLFCLFFVMSLLFPTFIWGEGGGGGGVFLFKINFTSF